MSETSAGQLANTDSRISIELVETRVRDGLELDGDEAFPRDAGSPVSAPSGRRFTRRRGSAGITAEEVKLDAAGGFRKYQVATRDRGLGVKFEIKMFLLMPSPAHRAWLRVPLT
jgi:hypothetical protein